MVGGKQHDPAGVLEPGLIFLVEWKRSPFAYKNGCNRIPHLFDMKTKTREIRVRIAARLDCFRKYHEIEYCYHRLLEFSSI